MWSALAFALSVAQPPKLIMAHYMPWYSAPPISKTYGWHWTMNHFDPSKGEFASQFHPFAGTYDSQDPEYVECQLLMMKAAGIDGVLIDWYGIDNLWDYPFIHKASELVFEETKKLGLKFGVVYEDQTLKYLIENKVVREEDAVATGKRTMKWLDDHWFKSPNYLKILDKPALLVFGPQGYKDDDWTRLLEGVNVSFFTLHHRRGPAVGAFDWPLPQGGNEGCEAERLKFLERTKQMKTWIAAAYPRFQDIYKQAAIHGSWGTVADKDGSVFQHTLEAALEGNAPVVQIATWNDWGEGTQIEPSKEFGIRDLVTTQQMRHRYFENYSGQPTDISVPKDAYLLRKAGKITHAQWDKLAEAMTKGSFKRAASLLAEMGR